MSLLALTTTFCPLLMLLANVLQLLLQGDYKDG
jgi:hypothetical protein